MAAVLAVYYSRMEADVAAALLGSCGIRASVVTDSASGFEPQLELIRGVRVIVDDADLDEAAEVLGVEPPPPVRPLSPERERLVRVVRDVILAVAGVGLIAALVRLISG